MKLIKNNIYLILGIIIFIVLGINFLFSSTKKNVIIIGNGGPKYMNFSYYQKNNNSNKNGNKSTNNGNKSINFTESKSNGLESNQDENLTFIKQYYKDLGDGKIEEVYNKTSWETGKKSFDTFNGWYEGIKEVKVNSINSLGDNKYKIDVDLFYEGKEKPENYKMIKKVIENGGTKILETLKK